MSIVFGIAYLAVLLFFISLIIRLVFEWISMFAREYRPKGIVLVLIEAVFTVTDPPLRGLRRVVPPLKLGGIQLDLAFLILALACSFIMPILLSLSQGV